ncbi:MAG: hypothetical protein ACXABO_13965 [Promethearchaeota archaeon]|jgi:hypothetical protein
MPDKEKAIKNYEPLDVAANFIIVYKDEESSMEGWISLEKTLSHFIFLLKGEIEYHWGSEFAYMGEYLFFYIDINDKNRLKDIKDDNTFQKVKKLKEIFVVILHNEIKYRIIENLPLVFEWFASYSPS